MSEKTGIPWAMAATVQGCGRVRENLGSRTQELVEWDGSWIKFKGSVPKSAGAFSSLFVGKQARERIPKRNKVARVQDKIPLATPPPSPFSASPWKP